MISPSNSMTRAESAQPAAASSDVKLSNVKLSNVEILVQKRLSQSAYYALRYLSCQDHEGIVTIIGRVPSYYLKQVAQTIVSSIEQVGGVINRLEVIQPLGDPPDEPF